MTASDRDTSPTTPGSEAADPPLQRSGSAAGQTTPPSADPPVPGASPSAAPSPATLRAARRVTVASVALLAVLALAWELWLAPLRPGGSLLALKALPLLAALPGLVRGRLKTFQWWSLLLMVYLTEGLVRATSDTGPSAGLAAVETLLAALAFAGVLVYTGAHKRPKAPRHGERAA